MNINSSNQSIVDLEELKSCLENLKSSPVKTIELAIKIINETGEIKRSFNPSSSSYFFSSSCSQEKTGSPEINRLVESIETNDPSLIRLAQENGYESSEAYVMNALKIALYNQYALNVIKPVSPRGVHYSSHAVRHFCRAAHQVEENSFFNGFSSLFDLIEGRLSQIDTPEKSVNLNIPLTRIEIDQWEEKIEKRNKCYEKFKKQITENQLKNLFSKDSNQRRMEYLEFSRSFYRSLKVLISKNEDSMFYDDIIPYLIITCYTGWMENSSQLSLFAKKFSDQENIAELNYFQIAHQINVGLLDEIIFHSVLPRIARNVFQDKFEDNISNVHSIRAIRQLSYLNFGLGITKSDVSSSESLMPVFQSHFNQLIPEMMKNEYTSRIIIDRIKEFYHTKSNEEREIIWEPIIEQYKKYFISLFDKSDYLSNHPLKLVYNKLLETSEIENFEEYVVALKEIHQQFIDIGENPLFSALTPKEKGGLDLKHSAIGRALERQIRKEEMSSQTQSSFLKKRSSGMADLHRENHRSKGNEKINDKRKREGFLFEEEDRPVKKEKIENFDWRKLFNDLKNDPNLMSEEEKDKIESLIIQFEQSENEEIKNHYLDQQKKRINEILLHFPNRIMLNQIESLKKMIEDSNGCLSDFGAALIGSASKIFKLVDRNIDQEFQDLINCVASIPTPSFVKSHWKKLMNEGKEYHSKIGESVEISQLFSDNEIIPLGWKYDLIDGEFEKKWQELIKCDLNSNITLNRKMADDKNFIYLIVGENGLALKCASKKLQSDKNTVVRAINQNNLAVRYANRDVVLEVIKQGEFSLHSLHKDVVLEFVKQNGLILEFVSEKLRFEREIVLAAVKQNRRALKCVVRTPFIMEVMNQDGLALEFAGAEYQSDREVVWAAVKQNGKALQFAEENFKSDENIVRKAFQQSKSALEHANRDAVLKVVVEDRWALKFASAALQDDKEVVLATVEKYGGALEFASKALQNDKEVVLAAVKGCGEALEFASKALQNDKEVILAALNLIGDAFKFASAALQDDKEFVLGVVEKHGDALKFASAALQDDKEVVLAAVKEYGEALEFASEALQNDKEVVLIAVKEWGNALRFASEALQDDKEVVLLAVNAKEESLEFASEALRNDEDIILAAVKDSPELLELASEALRANQEFLLKKIAPLEDCVEAFEYISQDLKLDKEFMLKAIALNDSLFRFAHISLMEDRNFAVSVIDQTDYFSNSSEEIIRFANNKERFLNFVVEGQMPLSLSFMNESLRKDREVVLAAVDRDGKNLKYADDSLRENKEFILKAVRQPHQSLFGGDCFLYAAESLRNNKPFILEIVSQWPRIFKHIPESFSNSKPFILEIISRCPEVFKYIPEAFRQDPEVYGLYYELSGQMNADMATIGMLDWS